MTVVQASSLGFIEPFVNVIVTRSVAETDHACIITTSWAAIQSA
jgi:hypothetical protein